MRSYLNNWNETPRAGATDLWNAQLYIGAEWTSLDNPKVRCTATKPPNATISWRIAKQIHRKQLNANDRDYHVSAFIHCCTDDQKFDGEREGIWKKWEFFYEVASHFDGITGIDFSTNADFPEPFKRYQFHRMRAIEHGAIQRNIPVIPNARWGTTETWSYCFDALPETSMLFIGTVGSGLGNIENRPLFEAGLRELIKQKAPHEIVVLGSANYSIFEEVKAHGIAIHQLDGETNIYFKTRRKSDV
jgi:hypothetical protein